MSQSLSFVALLKRHKSQFTADEFRLALKLDARWKDDTAEAYADDGNEFVVAVKDMVKPSGDVLCLVCSAHNSLCWRT